MSIKKNILRYPIIILGLCLFGLGVHFMILAHLGTDPWSVLHVGLANYLPLTIGQINQIVGLCLIVLCYPLGIKPGIGTVLNMFFIGFFYDLWVRWGLFPEPATLFMQYFYLVAGIVVLGIGSGIYISTNLGAGPRDGLTLGLHKRLGISIRLARSGTELAVLTGGYFIGGLVGIGTLIFALAIGPMVQYSLKICDRHIAPLFTSVGKKSPLPVNE